MSTPAATLLTTVAGAVSIDFGVWHLFVPRLWHSYSYVDAGAAELVLAVRAVNALFSLALVLFGLVNLALVHGRADSFSLLVVLSATCVLWAARVAMQIAHPQGSAWPALRFGLLGAFAAVLACYFASLVLVALGKGAS